MVKGGYKRLQVVIGCYNRLQGVALLFSPSPFHPFTRSRSYFRGITRTLKYWGFRVIGVTGIYKGLQGITGVNKGLKKVTGGYRGLQGVKGVKGGYRR